jgi:hypothetical protein
MAYLQSTSDFVDFYKVKDDEVFFKIKMKDEGIGGCGDIDHGLLLTIIDTYSSFATLMLSEGKRITQGSLSINLKVYSLQKMEANSVYIMVVKLKYRTKSLIILESEIFKENGELVKTSLHMKKLIKQLNTKF